MRLFPSVNDPLLLGWNSRSNRPLFINRAQRETHFLSLGRSGAGKTSHYEFMVRQDIRAGRGVAVVDPHGDLADAIIGKIPESRLADVILLDLLDRGWPPGFNLLQWETIEERDLLIDELYAVIDNLYDMRQTGGPIFEMHFRGVLKLLMGDRKHDDFSPTLMDFVTCYLSRDFRHWLLARTEEPATHDFVREMERAGGERAVLACALLDLVLSHLARQRVSVHAQRVGGLGQAAVAAAKHRAAACPGRRL